MFTNKAIFSDPQFKLCQLSFASFHFVVTFLTLYMFSRPPFNKFTPRRVPFTTMLPLCITMCLNVILPNFSLAFSSVTFYQLARILLTPAVALMNFLMYRATLPRKAILTLIPVCLGVGIVSYYDSLPADNANVKTTSPIGVFFAFSGVLASSLYTVWIGSYHRKLEMNSMQLLFNQAPWSAFLLLYVIPFVDTFPQISHTSLTRWLMILMVRVGLPRHPSRTATPENMILRKGTFILLSFLANRVVLSLVFSPPSSTFLNSSSLHRPALCRVR